MAAVIVNVLQSSRGIDCGLGYPSPRDLCSLPYMNIVRINEYLAVNLGKIRYYFWVTEELYSS